MSETIVINQDGLIVDKHIGAIAPKVLEETLLPLIGRSQETNQTTSPAVSRSKSEES